MKKIKLKFIGTGYNNFCQAHVKIYDSCGKKVLDKTTYNGVISFLPKQKLYKIKTCYNNSERTFLLCINNFQDTYYFVFNNAYLRNNPSRTFTFLLTDQFYANLPIRHGELILNGTNN